MLHEVTVKSTKKVEFLEITSKINELIGSSGIKEGICYLFVPHTTAGITINEHTDPSVVHDIKEALSKLAPTDAAYTHLEGNADSHIKATIVGTSEVVFIKEGRLLLGTWQGIFFCEFDGPRTRSVIVKIMEG